MPRGRGGGPSGPRLPGALRDQLGVKSRPSRGGFKKGPAGRNAPFVKPKRVGGPKHRLPEQDDEEDDQAYRGTRPSASGPSQRRDVGPSTARAEVEPAAKAPAANFRAEVDAGPSSSSSSRKKISADTSTPLSRLLAAGGDGDAGPTSRKSKGKKRAADDADAPLDPSIMRSVKRTKQEQDEDDEIAWLEWKLGGGKRKGKGAALEDEDDDGLGDLLSIADRVVPSGGVSDDDEEHEEEDMDDEGGEGEFSDDPSGDSDVLQDDDDALEDYWTEESDEEASEGGPDPVEAARQLEINASKAKDNTAGKAVRFGEETAADAADAAPAAAGGKYVPPHLRKQQAVAASNGSVKSESMIRLERKLQGLINKLSEANIDAILGEIEQVYRSNSRHDCTSAVTSLLLQTISNEANLLDSFVVLHAALCTALYRVIGLEFGAHLVQTLVDRYTEVSANKDASANLAEDSGKQSLNLLVFISELYNFQVVSCRLVYDLIREFIEALPRIGSPAGDFAVEALLKVLKASGPQLRSDDPTALKDIVQLVQQNTAGIEQNMGARAKFMVETLTNLKGSKNKALPGGEAGAEATRRMKKYLGGLEKKRTVLVHEPLRASLSDLRSAESRGKWWLVGAAWSGDPLTERSERQKASVIEAKTPKTVSADNDDLSGSGINDVDALMKLAKQQGMNTDVRRNVFVVMMSSEDYRHAVQRLMQLKFTEVQQREFVRVAMHCLGVEPAYNPYYALILANLCADSYSHRFTMQYALWDFLRSLGQSEVGGAGVGGSSGAFADDSSKITKARICNMAKAIAWVIARGGADLLLFKPVDFADLTGKAKIFFRNVLAYLLVALHTESPVFKLPKRIEEKGEEVSALFEKTLGHTSLAHGLAYFVQREMTPEKVADMLDARQAQLIQEGLDQATQVLSRAV